MPSLHEWYSKMHIKAVFLLVYIAFVNMFIGTMKSILLQIPYDEVNRAFSNQKKNNENFDQTVNEKSVQLSEQQFSNGF
jgi:hypothetical protein